MEPIFSRTDPGVLEESLSRYAVVVPAERVPLRATVSELRSNAVDPVEKESASGPQSLPVGSAPSGTAPRLLKSSSPRPVPTNTRPTRAISRNARFAMAMTQLPRGKILRSTWQMHPVDCQSSTHVRRIRPDNRFPESPLFAIG